jgi:DNA polymerase delta subunit 1
VAHVCDTEWSQIAPLRILSLDVEMKIRGVELPKPELDPVIQIANMVTRYGWLLLALGCMLILMVGF